MLKKIKNFVKKFWPFILLTLLILILIFLIVFAVSKKDSKDEDTPPSRPSIKEDDFDVEENLQGQGFEYNLPDEVLSEVSSFDQSYDIFEVEIKDHFEWVSNFVKGIGKNNLEYSKRALPPLEGTDNTLDQTMHYWKEAEDIVFYNVENDFLFLNFENAIYIPNVQFNPNDAESLKGSLEKISRLFFSEDFKYIVHEVYREGNYYRVEYSRLLNDMPVYSYDDFYLLLSPDGRLKEGRFLLAEFKKIGTEVLISKQDLKDRVSSPEYRKSTTFQLNEIENYDKLGLYEGGSEGNEVGLVDIKDIKVGYHYRGKFDPEVYPRFIFSGEGIVELNNETAEATFVVRIGIDR